MLLLIYRGFWSFLSSYLCGSEDEKIDAILIESNE